MARGEPEPRGTRGPGVAIGVTFGVLCLAATFLVVWTTNACEGCTPWSLFGPSMAAMPPEPFPGSQAALVPLRSRDCPDSTAAPMPGAAASTWHQDQIRVELETRGYVAAGTDWATTLTLPADSAAPAELAGTCGVIAVVSDPGAMITKMVTGAAGEIPTCDAALITVAICGGQTFRVEGTGIVRTRAWSLPGATPELVAATGLPLEVVLAHAEAEQHLRSLGWGPSDEVIVQTVAAPPAGTGVAAHTTLTPPRSPSSGCIPWVAVGVGIGTATATWPGYAPDLDRHPARFTAGAIECAPSAPTRGVSLEATDHGAAGSTVYWRAFGATGGPALPGPPQQATAISATAMHVVDARRATLPAPIAATPVPEEP